MSLDEKLAALRLREVPWDDIRQQRVWSELNQARPYASNSKRTKVRRVAVLAGAALIFAILGALAFWSLSTMAPTASTATASHPSTALFLADLGRAELSEGAEVELVLQSPHRVVAAQHKGVARYTIDPQHKRQFSVRVDEFWITVVGTVFSVDMAKQRIVVAVERGVVRVTDSERDFEIRNGESVVLRRTAAVGPFPSVPPMRKFKSNGISAERDVHADAGITSATTFQSSPSQIPDAKEITDVRKDLSDTSTHKKNDREGNRVAPAPGRSIPENKKISPARTPAKESRILREQPARQTNIRSHIPTDSTSTCPDALVCALREVDRLRRQGNLVQASQQLRHLISEHPTSPSVPLALFSLGNVERRRGRWAPAAAAYYRCWQWDPTGPLAEDASAEAAICWSNAGELERAKNAAQRYLNQYPRGIHQTKMTDLRK